MKAFNVILFIILLDMDQCIGQDTRAPSSQCSSTICLQVFDLQVDLQHKYIQLDERSERIERELNEQIATQEEAAKQQIEELKERMASQEEAATQQAQDLQLRINEQEVQIQDLQQKIQAHEEQLQDEEPVAFTAYATSSQTLSSDETVSFDSTLINFGENYNPQTSTFTCPVTAVYVFSVSVPSYRGEEVRVSITKNNSINIATVLADDNDGGDDEITKHESHASRIGIVLCNAGERVWIKSRSIGRTYSSSDPVTSFSGFLLYRI